MSALRIVIFDYYGVDSNTSEQGADSGPGRIEAILDGAAKSAVSNEPWKTIAGTPRKRNF